MRKTKLEPIHNLVFFSLLGLILISCGTKSSTEKPGDTFNRINLEVIENSRAYATLKEATSQIGHRLTGSANGHKAEEYVFEKLKAYGFEDVRYDEFEVKAWSRGNLKVMIDGDSVPAVTLGHSPLKSDISLELVDVKNGLAADFDSVGNKVKGKIALICLGLLEGTDKKIQNLHRSEKTAIAIAHGASGIIMFNMVDKGVLLTGTASVTGKLIDIPAVCIGKEVGLALKKKLRRKSISAHITMTNQSDLIKARNVIATLRGSELPGERVLVGGHLDSWDLATGAIDNGIGSFSVLDMARAFKANHLEPRRTVQFILFMGEEQGLLGSRHFVAREISDGSIGSIRYMMNLDMTGNPIGIHAGSQLDDTTFFKNLGAEIHQVDTTFSNRFSQGPGLHSDHQPFLLQGIPTLSLVSNLDRTIYRCYHSDCDQFDLVNEVHLRNTARFGTMVLYGLANAKLLPAHSIDSEATRQYLTDHHLKEPLVIAGDWRWSK